MTVLPVLLHTCLIPSCLAGHLVQLTELCILTDGHACQIYRRRSTYSLTLAPLVHLSDQSLSTNSWVYGFVGGLSQLVQIDDLKDASPSLDALLAVVADFFGVCPSYPLMIVGGAGVEFDLKSCHQGVQCVVSFVRH